MSTDNNGLNERIKMIRVKKGLTMEEFGKQVLGANKSIVSKWEKGLTVPNNERLVKIAELGNISVSELLYGINPEIKEKVSKYTEEIMDTEIKEMHSQKYKLLYDPKFKRETIDYLVTRYNFNDLPDIGVKQDTKQLLDDILDKEIYERKYKPYTNKHATYLAYDLLKDQVMNRIDDYFRNENIRIHSNYLKDDEIKEELSFELYEKIHIILEEAQEKIRSLDS